MQNGLVLKTTLGVINTQFSFRYKTSIFLDNVIPANQIVAIQSFWVEIFNCIRNTKDIHLNNLNIPFLHTFPQMNELAGGTSKLCRSPI